jgi:uncharacterized membrane protein
MTPHADSESRIDGFLARLRAALRGMPEREIDDILREIRSHIAEVSEAEGSDVEKAIRSLGDPVDLATTYRAENLMVRAECSGSPLVILQALRHASRTRAGRFTATLLYVFGYAAVIAFWREAVHRLFVPARTALWYTPGSAWPFTFVSGGSVPAGSTELLGWWLIPAIIAAGWAVKYAVDRVAKWWLRRYRRGSERGAPC